MTSRTIAAKIAHLDHIQLKLNNAAGISVAVELRMRLIGQLSPAVQTKLKELATGNKRKRMSSEYWDCKLFLLDEAIIAVFHGTLEDHELEKIKKFRELRNELLHANFVDFVTLLGIEPEANKAPLNAPNIQEAIISIDTNQGFETFQQKAAEVVAILDRLIPA